MQEVSLETDNSRIRRSRSQREKSESKAGSFGSGGRQSESRGSQNLTHSRPSLCILIPADEPGTEKNPNFTTPNYMVGRSDEKGN